MYISRYVSMYLDDVYMNTPTSPIWGVGGVHGVLRNI